MADIELRESPDAAPGEPDASLRIVDAAGTCHASCALWVRQQPALDGRPTGSIGRFAAHDSAAARAVLDAACEHLAERGCEVAIGPLDGSTWRPYRFVIVSTDAPAFFLEPTNPPEWPEWWREAGFGELARYHSSLNASLAAARPAREVEGLPLRPLNMERFDVELRAIFELSAVAFADNFLYTPIAWEEFAASYTRLRALLDPRLVVFADDPARPGALAGFLLALPDRLEQERTGACTTLILKSMAVHREYRRRGLGSELIAAAQSAAAALGYARSIFALMHDDNHSARISRHHALVIRRYALFARELTP